MRVVSINNISILAFVQDALYIDRLIAVSEEKQSTDRAHSAP
jgi:hypothetical protein